MCDALAATSGPGGFWGLDARLSGTDGGGETWGAGLLRSRPARSGWVAGRPSRSARPRVFEDWRMEATTGFEPVIGVLQTLALPLGYVARGSRGMGP